MRNVRFVYWIMFFSCRLFAQDPIDYDEHEESNPSAISLVLLEAKMIQLHQPDTLIQSQKRWLDNQQQQADSFLSGQARLLGELKTDRFGRDIGYQNATLGLILPLWWPNERPLAQETVGALVSWQKLQLAAERQKLKLTLYQQTESYFGAREGLHHAQLAVKHAQQLLDHVQARYAQGDLSQFDVISAQADVQQRQQNLLSAQQTFDEERLAFLQLTGQSELPIVSKTPVSFVQPFKLTHCSQWLSAQNEVAFIRAQVNQAEQASLNKPEVTIATEQDQMDRFSPSNALARLGITIPIGAGPYRYQAENQLTWELSQAQVRFEKVTRMLESLFAQQSKRFTQSQQQLAQQKLLNEKLTKQYEMAQSAFRSGELDLRELLRIKGAWLEGQHTAELLNYSHLFSALALHALEDSE